MGKRIIEVETTYDTNELSIIMKQLNREQEQIEKMLEQSNITNIIPTDYAGYSENPNLFAD